MIFISFSFDEVFALSNAQYDQFMNSSPEFAQAENRLNAIWRRLQQVATREQMKLYRSEQRNWIQNERGYQVSELLRLAQTSPQQLPADILFNGQINEGKCYAFVTNNRTMALERIVEQLGNKNYQTSSVAQNTSASNNYQQATKWLEQIYPEMISGNLYNKMDLFSSMARNNNNKFASILVEMLYTNIGGETNPYWR
jgi:hypothetical protein